MLELRFNDQGTNYRDDNLWSIVETRLAGGWTRSSLFPPFCIQGPTRLFFVITPLCLRRNKGNDRGCKVFLRSFVELLIVNGLIAVTALSDRCITHLAEILRNIPGTLLERSWFL